jgi:hypothetical protein
VISGSFLICQHDLGIIRNIPWYRFDGVLLTRIILIFDRGRDRMVVSFIGGGNRVPGVKSQVTDNLYHSVYCCIDYTSSEWDSKSQR